MKLASTSHDLLVALLLVQNAMTRRSEAFFQEFGLTDAQFNILNLLAIGDSPMDQLTLTERLLVGKSSISIVLNRMVKADLIRREEHPQDRRKVVLSLTRKGRGLWQRVNPKYEANVQDIFGAIPMADRERFIDGLTLLYNALRKEVTDPSERRVLPLREMIEKLSKQNL